MQFHGHRAKAAHGVFLAMALATTTLSGCSSFGETIQNGYVVDQQTLALVPAGSSKEQVYLSLGTPSATATFDSEVFYYISQKRYRAIAFMKPRLEEQTVLAVYFTKDGTVDHLAHYSLKDGRVIDMLTMTTPTGGVEKTFLMRLLSGGINPADAAQQLLGHVPSTLGQHY